MSAVILRVLALVAAILFTCGPIGARQEQRATDPSTDLTRFLDGERLALQLPGLAAVVVHKEGSPRVYVSGERRLGKGDPITPADRMHLGSLTKAITATLVGALVEKQLIGFETTIGQTFPELSTKIHPAYRDVSVRQFLTHASGTEPYGTNVSFLPLLALKGTPTEQRSAFVERVLSVAPRFEPGTKHEYSSAGAAIVGAMAERVGGSPYRQLVQQLIFGPLGGHVEFGNPGLDAKPQPWGHVRRGGTVVEILPTSPLHTTPAAIEPAGGASPSLQDYGRFLQLHLRGLKGDDGILKASTIQALHGVATKTSVRRPGMGWNVMPRDGVASHEHFGSSGAYVAYATIQPSRDIAVAAFTNMGSVEGLRDAVAQVARQIATRVAAAEKSR